MIYLIKVSSKADKIIDKLDGKTIQRIMARLDELAVIVVLESFFASASKGAASGAPTKEIIFENSYINLYLNPACSIIST
jgi:hypothetical protein